MLGEVGTQPDVLTLLQRETEGNAFFLVETVRALAEEAGQLAAIGMMPLPDRVFAGGVQRINQRRLSRVPDWGQPLLKCAAVIGRQLDETLIQHLAQDVSVESWLNACAEAAVLEVTENRWRFTHDKLRETVVANLSETERPQLHRQVAQAIETIYPDDDQQAAILADHWHIAGDREKEAFYAYRAAESLYQLGLDQAQEQAIRALNLRPSDPLIWAKINILIAENYFTWGEYQKARAHYEATLAHARQHELTTEELIALDGLGQITYITRDLSMALGIYQDAITLARKAGDNLLLARLLDDQGAVLRFVGDHEAAFQALKASLDIVRKLNDPSQLAMSLYGISVIVRNQGRYEEACGYVEESIAILRQQNAVRDLGMSLNNLGICNTLLGNYEIALQHLEEGLAYRNQVGHPRGAAASKSAIGELYWVLGRYAEAETMFQEALDFWQSISDRWNTANSHNDVGFPLLVQGAIDRAAEHWRSGLQSGQEIQAGFLILKALIGFAWLAYDQGDEQQALRLLSLVQSHAASTQPLNQMWIQPLLRKMDRVLPPTDDIDLQKTINMLLDT
jgi:tetratricopeptide (TPR) repeat protein